MKNEGLTVIDATPSADGALPHPEPAVLEQRHRIEDLAQGDTVQIVRHRRAGTFDTRAGKPVEHEGQAAGLRVRQRPKQDRPDDGEDGRVGAKANGQRQDHGRGIRAILA